MVVYMCTHFVHQMQLLVLCSRFQMVGVEVVEGENARVEEQFLMQEGEDTCLQQVLAENEEYIVFCLSMNSDQNYLCRNAKRFAQEYLLLVLESELTATESLFLALVHHQISDSVANTPFLAVMKIKCDLIHKIGFSNTSIALHSFNFCCLKEVGVCDSNTKYRYTSQLNIRMIGYIQSHFS